MKYSKTTPIALLAVIILRSTFCSLFAAEKSEPVELTKTGEAFLAKYESMLDSLKEEAAAAIVEVDESKKSEFMRYRHAYNSLETPGEDSGPDQISAYRDAKREAASNALHIARSILVDIDGVLSNGEMDETLMKIAILTHGTPRGFAEFAQLGEKQASLLDGFLSDPVLMNQVLLAGGANGGEYGEALEVYQAIQAASEKAREPGILQRLALGTSLHQPWLKGKDRGGVHSTVFADHDTPDGQVARYLHYEQAYLAGELDDAFKDMNTWECKYITSDPYTNEELQWTREMMRNYRPDHITNPDYKFRYAGIVKTDVPYCSPSWNPDEGTTKVQQIVAGGGKCGPRAFYGRTACRSFGIPSRRSTQTGHAALNHWTPDGWVVLFGAWWSWNWCGSWGGEDFLLESQAREHPEEFIKVLRLQWIGDILNEDDVSIRHYGKGGGFWNALAFCKKEAVVAAEKAAALQAELAALSEEEAKVTLGETDEASEEKYVKPMPVIREEDRTIVTDNDGTLMVPAAACIKPTNHTDRIIFMNNLEGDTQVHYSRLGKRPDLMNYYIEPPAAGKYNLTMQVCTVGRDQSCLLRLNRRTLIDVDLPSTWGMWEDTKPVEVDLKEGRNSLMFTCKAPNRGVSIKQFVLTPIRE